MDLFEFLAVLFGTKDAPVTPEQRAAKLAAMDNDALKALSTQSLEAIEKASKGDIDPTVVASMKNALALKTEIATLLSERDGAVAKLGEEVDAVLKAAGLDACGACDDAGKASDAGGEGGDDDAEGDDDADGGEGGEDEDVQAGFQPRIPAGARAGAMAAAAGGAPAGGTKVAERKSVVHNMRAAVPFGKLGTGDDFESPLQLAEALVQRWSDIKGGRPGEKFTVAQVEGRFDEDRVLVDGDTRGNIEKMGGLDVAALTDGVQDLAAAICAPREPIYDLGCPSSTARPVANSLSAYRAPRGGVMIYPSPKLADVDGGRGVWTREDDEDDEAIKECATIPCNTPDNYDIYGIWRCMTIKNMNAMTYPELVSAFLNRLAALQAELAEVTMLNGMIGSVNTVSVHADVLNVGASIAAMETIIRAIEAYKNEERYGDVRFDGWAPRSTRALLVADLLLQRRTDNTSLADRVRAAADVDAAFAALGINMTWTYDFASRWTDQELGALNDGGAIPEWPDNLRLFVTPAGNMRRLDGGTLNIGVSPGNIYRDNASNARNEFTMFWESFEGIVDFGCKSLDIDLRDVCVGGHQVADVSPDCTPSQS